MQNEPMIFLGRSEKPEGLKLGFANRHGLIAGATGTGKTVTLQILAEGFSAAGVPVFAADVKGDLAGLSQPIEMSDGLARRAKKVGLDTHAPTGFPVAFWDLDGSEGTPIRATVSDMGPLLLSSLLDLNDTQTGVLTLAFRLADDDGLLLLDLKDLRALLVDVAKRRRTLSAEYGHVSTATVGAIQRRLLALEEQGADRFFGEPSLDLTDFLRTTYDGKGMVNILAADRLMLSPKLYATFLLWLLSELFEELPEEGDLDRPKLVFFFDEAHLLFDMAPKALLTKITQVVRLIRSKGVGVFFVTQNPLDVPDAVSSQLATRILHGLRAFTPREQRVVRAAAETFRPNPDFDAEAAIQALGIGEALVSTLEDKGTPSIVQRTLIRPPSSRMGVITEAERTAVRQASGMDGRYQTPVDRYSAYEMLKERASRQAAEAEAAATTEANRKAKPGRRSGYRRQSVSEAAIKSAARTVANSLARSLVRGLLGGLKRR